MFLMEFISVTDTNMNQTFIYLLVSTSCCILLTIMVNRRPILGTLGWECTSDVPFIAEHQAHSFSTSGNIAQLIHLLF